MSQIVFTQYFLYYLVFKHDQKFLHSEENFFGCVLFFLLDLINSARIMLE